MSFGISVKLKKLFGRTEKMDMGVEGGTYTPPGREVRSSHPLNRMYEKQAIKNEGEKIVDQALQDMDDRFEGKTKFDKGGGGDQPAPKTKASPRSRDSTNLSTSK